MDRKIDGRLDVGSSFRLQEDWDSIANGVSEAAMRAPQDGVGLWRERAFADGARDEVEQVLGDHGLYFTLAAWRMQLKRYCMRVALRFTIDGRTQERATEC